MMSSNSQKGFTLLFASLVGALVLTVGLAILSIALKQLTLASVGKATQQSFYSADAGTECALYLDRGAGLSDCRLGFFPAPSSTLPSKYWSCADAGVDVSANSKCFGKQISINGGGAPQVDPTTGYVTSEFTLDANSSNSSDTGATNNDTCFIVAVTKREDIPATPEDDTATIIESRGYNTCNVDAANRYERAIRSKNQ